jgi:putative thiamine transport system permease protein
MAFACHRRCKHCCGPRFRPYVRGALDTVVAEALRNFPRIVDHLPERMGYTDLAAEPGADGQYPQKTGRVALSGGEALLVAGLAGTLLPAFGSLPALGGGELGASAWRALGEAPGFATALRLSLFTGWAATLLSLALALGIVAFVHHRPWARRLGEAMAPMLAMPHSALAIGFAFLILPSGWVARALSPGLTGWELPPDVATVGHASGWPLVAALLLKEVPYLVLMTLAALNQVPARAQVALARSLGYGPVQAWFAVVLPQVYAQIRPPVFAVLAFSLSVVDVALILGPGNPPTLAVLAVRWFGDPDTRCVFPASAAATLLLGVVAASIGLWFGAERLLARWALQRLQRGVRRRRSAWLGGAATAAGAALVVARLEHESRQRLARPSRSLWLLYLPLLLPQVAFLFGPQVLLVRRGADGRLSAVIWAHLVFVLPYLFLSLADPWRAFDERYTRAALALGATRWRAFWRIKLPLLLRPLLLSCAVAFAVSVGQYLPTLFAGAGRVATLTTEAVTLAGGADRRVIGTWALLQAAFPLAVYWLAAAAPRWLFRHRKGMA